MGLTAHEREQAKQYWFLGWSARMIADATSRESGLIVTKNSIIGMVFRGKWPRCAASLQNVEKAVSWQDWVEASEPVAESEPAPKVPALAKRARKPRAPRERVVRTPRDNPPPGPVVTVFGPCTIVDLTDYRCKWPIGEVRSPQFRYCGAAKSIDGPYCREHAAMSFVPRDRP